MSESSAQYFHLTIGPVQSFVAQARRTRDFWSGSFLLSWLSSVAMLVVEEQGGKIRFPIPDQQFLAALKGTTRTYPKQGSVPNRFKALGVEVGGDFNPEIVVHAIHQTWLALAETIWLADLEPVLQDSQRDNTRAIWERQVTAFWDINWCMTPDEAVSNVLDRRKNWRCHTLPDEHGAKCMMMEGFQELSAYFGSSATELNTFWSSLQQALKFGETDLRVGEQLCALAFIKRRFVRHFANFRHTLNIQDKTLNLQGWPLKAQVPSVLYIAASPWYAAALRAAHHNPATKASLETFLDEADSCVGHSEAATPSEEVSAAVASLQMRTQVAGIDGTVFHASQLEPGAKRFSDANSAQRTLKALKQLRTAANLPEPSAFYAVLLMDGDSLGSQMSNTNKQQAISKALLHFTASTPDIVSDHNGFLVYAGGDDVLALLPVDYAVRCAQALREHYEDSFSKQNESLPASDVIVTSLSAAIEFTHIKTPLTFVLNDAHNLLDRIAKDETGRDALAVRVWKPGGLHLQWSQPWESLQPEAKPAQFNLLSDAADTFALRERNSPFTHRFIFKVSALLERLPDNIGSNTGDSCSASSLIKTLLQSELLHSGIKIQGNQNLTQSEINAVLDPLLKLSTQHRRFSNNGKKPRAESTGQFKDDALKLVRFLVQNSIGLHMEAGQ